MPEIRVVFVLVFLKSRFSSKFISSLLCILCNLHEERRTISLQIDALCPLHEITQSEKTRLIFLKPQRLLDDFHV